MTVAQPRLVLAALSALLLQTHAATAQVYPEPTGYVTDTTGALTDATKERLVGLLRRLHEKTQAQVGVAIIPTTGGVDIETYAIKLFERWKVGMKGQDNGVLFLAAVNDHKMRIEVGYGLEGALPDGKTGEILRTIVRPRFQAGDVNGGVLGGVEAVVAAIAAEYKIAPADVGLGETAHTLAATKGDKGGAGSQPGSDWWLILLGVGLGVIGVGAAVVGIVREIAGGKAASGSRRPERSSGRRNRRSGSSSSIGSTSAPGSSSSSGSSTSSSSDTFGGGSSGGGGASSDW
jgi:uncharacterized protein